MFFRTLPAVSKSWTRKAPPGHLPGLAFQKGKYHHDGDGTILHHDKLLKTRLSKPMDKSFCSSLCFLLLLKKNRIFAGTGIDIFNYTKGEEHFYVCLYILE